jgi:hypothetical protein
MEYSTEFEVAELYLNDMAENDFEQWQRDRMAKTVKLYALVSIARSLEKLAWKEMN